MGRSGYSDDLEQWSLIRWRGQVASAIRGARGQAFLRDLLAALDAMPEKRLIDQDLERPDGSVCALGCIGKARGVPLPAIDHDEIEYGDPDYIENLRHGLAKSFGIAHQLVAEIEFMNDEASILDETPEQRWTRMRAWVAAQIRGMSSQTSTEHGDNT